MRISHAAVLLQSSTYKASSQQECQLNEKVPVWATCGKALKRVVLGRKPFAEHATYSACIKIILHLSTAKCCPSVLSSIALLAVAQVNAAGRHWPDKNPHPRRYPDDL